MKAHSDGAGFSKVINESEGRSYSLKNSRVLFSMLGALALSLIVVPKSNAQLTILHSFGDGTVANDGAFPNGLISAPSGNLYGATANQAVGTVFRISP